MAQDQSTATVTLVHPRAAGDGGAAQAAGVPQALVSPPAAQPLASQAPAAGPEKPKRGLIRRVLLPIIVLGAIGYGGKLSYDYFVEGRFIVSTDDAYVGADTAIISAKLSGYVVDVAVANNQAVHKGDLLVRIDPVDYQLAIDAARNKIASQEATIARVGRQADAQLATIAGAQAQLEAAQSQLDGNQADARRASLQFDRAQKLTGINVGSEQQLEVATADKARTISAVATSRANIANAQAALAASKATLDVLNAQKVEAERLRAELQTSLEKAQHDMSFTEIRAPFDGVVGNKAVVLGQYAQPGTRLLALVGPASTYVDANLKETQLETVHVGQHVDVAIDSRGGATVPGVVQSIAPGSGAQFSLLPPDNATGNFTKVVQRVAVRIALSPDDVKAAHLVPGLSVVASIHTRDESLPKPTLFGALGIDLASNSRAAK
jgi:membrane fusion protein (multidrug efflux system)